MSIPRAEIKRAAKLIAEGFLSEKTAIELQSITQDHIDAWIIPITSEIEDLANLLVAEKIKEAIASGPMDPDDEWWTRATSHQQ